MLQKWFNIAERNWLFEVSIPFIFHGQYLWVSFTSTSAAGPGGTKPRHESRDLTSIPKVTLNVATTKVATRNGQKEGCLMNYLCDMFDVSRIFAMLTSKNWGNAMGWNMLRPRTGTFLWKPSEMKGWLFGAGDLVRKTWTSSSFLGLCVAQVFLCVFFKCVFCLLVTSYLSRNTVATCPQHIHAVFALHIVYQELSLFEKP